MSFFSRVRSLSSAWAAAQRLLINPAARHLTPFASLTSTSLTSATTNTARIATGFFYNGTGNANPALVLHLPAVRFSTSGQSSSTGNSSASSTSGSSAANTSSNMADTQAQSRSSNIPVHRTKEQQTHQVDESKRHGQHPESRNPQDQQLQHQNQIQNQNQNMMTDRNQSGFFDLMNPANWINDFFSHPFGTLAPAANQLFNWPRNHLHVDIVNNPTEFIVRAELPGVRKEDVKINLDGDILTIQGERRSENYEKTANYVRRECSYGSMSRSIRLPDDALLDKITAKYEDGVVNIQLPRQPKKQEQNRVRQIPLQ